MADHAEEFCRRVREELAKADFERKRALLELLVDRVVVTDGEVEIRYALPTGPDGERQPFCRLRADYLPTLPGQKLCGNRPKVRRGARWRGSHSAPVADRDCEGTLADCVGKEERLYMLVAIDRTSKFAYVELHQKVTTWIAGEFVRALITILIDHGIHFTTPSTTSSAVALINRTLKRGGIVWAHVFQFSCA